MKLNKKYYKVKRIFIPKEILRSFKLTYDLLCKSGDFYKCTAYKATGQSVVYFSNTYEILDRIGYSFKSRNNA